MIRHATCVLLGQAFAGTLLSASVLAQGTASPNTRRVGVGVAISDAGEVAAEGAYLGSTYRVTTAALLPTIFIPIDVTSRFRLEPELSGYRNSNTHIGGTFGDDTSSSSLLQVGTGVFGLARHERFTLYYGGRVASLRFGVSSIRNTREYTSSARGWLLAPTMGAEYFLTEFLSVGGEASLKFVSWNNETSPSMTTGTSVASHGALALRFYFPL